MYVAKLLQECNIEYFGVQKCNNYAIFPICREVMLASSEQYNYGASQAVDEDFNTLWQAVKPVPGDGPGWNETDTWIRAHFKLPVMTNCVQPNACNRDESASKNSNRLAERLLRAGRVVTGQMDQQRRAREVRQS